jgi:hypothetical protein
MTAPTLHPHHGAGDRHTGFTTSEPPQPPLQPAASQGRSAAGTGEGEAGSTPSGVPCPPSPGGEAILLKIARALR